MEPEVIERMLQSVEGHFYGKYRGRVVDNRDSTHRGRLRVSVPAVMGDQAVWALPCVPYAGDGVGLFALPEPGTGVWVEFEAGDPSYPIWVGCFWGDGQIAAADAVPEIKFLKTGKLTVRIDDQRGELLIENTAGSRIHLTATGISQQSKRVTQQAGARKTALSAVGFDVNDGAFTVT